MRSCIRQAAVLLLAGIFCTSISLAEDLKLSTVDPGSVGLSVERLGRIEAMVRGYVDQGQIPGAVYAVARRGRLAHIDTIGPMREDTIFRIFSMTKPTTVVAVLQLYEEGRFMLTDPVSRYLPEFTDMHIYVDARRTLPASRPITIEDLLTHTAGLTYEPQ